MHEYSHRSHSVETLARWARRLRVFRFCRAIGGHANDGDELLASLRYSSEAELTALLGALQVPVVYLAADRPRPIPGKGYAASEFDKFESVIEPFLIRQPGHSLIANEKVFIWGSRGALSLTISDAADPYEVSEACVESAVRVEAVLASVAASVIEPPLDQSRCLCPKFFPEVWAQASR